MNEMLLRGCMLKNSRYILGLVVYTGPESRIQMNAAKTPNKVGPCPRRLHAPIHDIDFARWCGLPQRLFECCKDASASDHARAAWRLAHLWPLFPSAHVGHVPLLIWIMVVQTSSPGSLLGALQPKASSLCTGLAETACVLTMMRHCFACMRQAHVQTVQG